jgi:hypothetical protein
MRRIALTLTLVVAITTVLAAQDSQSSARAKALVQRLTDKQMDAAATIDPDHPDRVIAALYVAPSQLLVVSAKRSDVATLSENIHAGKYRDVYMDLQMAPVTQDKLFIHDLGADGLNRTGKSVVDNVYENGVRAELVKGGPTPNRFATIDTEYTRMLGALLSALDSPPTQPTTSSPATLQSGLINH